MCFLRNMLATGFYHWYASTHIIQKYFLYISSRYTKWLTQYNWTENPGGCLLGGVLCSNKMELQQQRDSHRAEGQEWYDKETDHRMLGCHANNTFWNKTDLLSFRRRSWSGVCLVFWDTEWRTWQKGGLSHLPLSSKGRVVRCYVSVFVLGLSSSITSWGSLRNGQDTPPADARLYVSCCMQGQDGDKKLRIYTKGHLWPVLLQLKCLSKRK